MRRAFRLICVLCAFATALPAPSSALGLIRDAEVETTLARIANPILRAAAVNPATVDIYIVSDRSMNAFVAGGRNVFLHSGLLMKLDDIDELRAVIAHEVGHITGGHLTRRNEALRGARGVAVLGMLGAAAATIGGSPDAGVAIASSTSQIAQRSMLAHSRAEESSADQAGLRYLAAAGFDPGAMLDVMRRFSGQDVISSGRRDAYARTHPMWSDRLHMLEERAATLPAGSSPSETDIYWHRRMIAKLTGFLSSGGEVARRYPAADTSEYATLARAIAAHRRPSPDRAAALAQALIDIRPEDAFYHELLGQFLLEAGRAGPAADAYRTAITLAPDQPLMLGGLGRALLNLDTAESNAEARDALDRSATLDGNDPRVLRDLALAEARLGNDGAAALATAERFVIEGRFGDAHRQAERAAALLPTGSPGWRQAQDVITVSRRALN